MTERLTGHTLLISLIATPIRHSMSPTMHNEAFAKLGLDYAYLAFEVDNSTLKPAVDGIRALGIRGSNVSMPNKPEAKLIGAVNTVTNKDGKGHLVGYNTDGIGAIKALEDEGVTVKDQSITLTGAGGAATAIAIQAAFDGAKELYIFNINDDVFENAKETAKKINDNTNCRATVTDLADQAAFKSAIQKSSIYIDATSVGMKPLQEQSLINDPEMIRSDLVVFDVVYAPRETKLLRFAKEHGAKKVINGLGMMLYQGAAAFQLFTDEEMPVTYIKELLFDE